MNLGTWAIGLAAGVALAGGAAWWVRRAFRGLSAQIAVLTLVVHELRDHVAAPKD